MSEALTPEQTILHDLQAQHPNTKLVAKKTKHGLVVMRVPTAAEIDKWQASKDSRRKAEDELVTSCAVYPVQEVVTQYLQSSPLLGSVLVVFLKAAALGMPEKEADDVAGFPSDLADGAAAKALNRDVWQVMTEFGRVTLRLPLGVELDNFETSKLSQRITSEGLVLSCVLAPETEVVRSWFMQRPLMGQWLSGKLREWCVGEVEDLNSRQ